MIFIGSAGSRMFLICARISTDFAAISLPCSACAEVKGGFGTNEVWAAANDATHKKHTRYIMGCSFDHLKISRHWAPPSMSIEYYTSLKPLRFSGVESFRFEGAPMNYPSRRMFVARLGGAGAVGMM